VATATYTFTTDALPSVRLRRDLFGPLQNFQAIKDRSKSFYGDPEVLSSMESTIETSS
jgi:hypothetical protein